MRITAIAAFCGFLGVGASIGASRAMAQAPPGPLPSPQSQGIPIPPPRTRPKRKEPAPRSTIGGDWKLNSDESDDPRRKIKETKADSGARYPRGGGGPSIGFPFPGAGGPMGSPGGGMPRGQGGEDNPKLLEVVQPASLLTINIKTAEVDVTENGGRKLIFYTDGRQLQKAKDATALEIAAHWDGNRLVSDEKSPEKGKMSRTFELSQDGRQFYETINVDTNKSKSPVLLQYVYDISSPETELTHETDPDQPVMKRRADKSDASSQPGADSGQPPDPDQPTMKRRSDDDSSSTTQSPQTQQSTTPDPDQPVMKRRTDSGNSSPQ